MTRERRLTLRAQLAAAQAEIEAVRRMSAMRLVTVTPEGAVKALGLPGFIPVCQYGDGSSCMLPGEIGRAGGDRYIVDET